MIEKSDHILALIPARYASSRFPGKLLRRIDGLTILERVYNQLSFCTRISEYAIILDHPQLQGEADRIGAKYILNEGEYVCGTDRCIAQLDAFDEVSILINVQGDQPFIDPRAIDALVDAMLADPTIDISTLRTSALCDNASPHVVKVYVDKDGRALEFSRLLNPEREGYQHIGVYGFRKNIVDIIRNLEPTKNEKKHNLEQLRWMDHGITIHTVAVDHVPVSIDIPEHLNRNF